MKAPLFALALSLTASSAFAADGTINFLGKLTAATCPIDIIDPIGGGIGNKVTLGEVRTADFGAVNAIAGETRFQMRLDPATCPIGANTQATVTLKSNNSGTGTRYPLNPITGAAEGIAVAIKDASNNFVDNGGTSTDYTLNTGTAQTLMDFRAMYIRTAANDADVKPGQANADVEFTVTLS